MYRFVNARAKIRWLSYLDGSEIAIKRNCVIAQLTKCTILCILQLRMPVAYKLILILAVLDRKMYSNKNVFILAGDIM